MWARGVLLLALAASACVTPAIERSWHEARTPNFVIWAALDGYESAEVARELEAYRSALALSTSLRLTAISESPSFRPAAMSRTTFCAVC